MVTEVRLRLPSVSLLPDLRVKFASFALLDALVPLRFPFIMVSMENYIHAAISIHWGIQFSWIQSKGDIYWELPINPAPLVKRGNFGGETSAIGATRSKLQNHVFMRPLLYTGEDNFRGSKTRGTSIGSYQ